MSARDAILSAIRAAAVPPAPAAKMPGQDAAHGDSDRLREQFLRVLAEVGGRGVERPSGTPMDALLDELVGADRANVMVLRGRFAVAENGAVYVDAADVQARNDIVRLEQMVVIIPFDAIVPTLHEAVRLMPVESTCGWFLSGPSKTADIEQSLVFGAQGSRTHLVVLDRG